MDISNNLIIINNVIQCIGYALVGIVDHLVAACTVDTLSGVGCTGTVILKLRTELDAIGQTVEGLPDLAEVQLSVGTTVDTEVLTLVLSILELVDRVLDVYITSRILDIGTILIVRNRPGQHTTQSVVVVTSTCGRLREAVAILLSTIRSVHRHTHGEVRQHLTLE